MNLSLSVHVLLCLVATILHPYTPYYQKIRVLKCTSPCRWGSSFAPLRCIFIPVFETILKSCLKLHYIHISMWKMHRQCAKDITLRVRLQWQRKVQFGTPFFREIIILNFPSFKKFLHSFVGISNASVSFSSPLFTHVPLHRLLSSFTWIICNLFSFFPCTWPNNQVISTSFTIIEACWHALPLQSYHWEHGFRGQDAFIFHLETSHT